MSEPVQIRGQKKKGLRAFPNGFPSSTSGRTHALDTDHVRGGRDVVVPEFRTKLCQAMASLEREYEVLYLENEARKAALVAFKVFYIVHCTVTKQKETWCFCP